MKPITMDSSTANDPLEAVDWVHVIFTLSLSRYIELISTETSPISIQGTRAFLDICYG